MSAIKDAMPSDDVMMLAGIGHNGAPEPTPFDFSEQEIGDLYEEAKHWLDGEPVETQAQCDAIQKLMRSIQDAEKRAEASQKAERDPHNKALTEIGDRYNPLIGKTTKITGKTKLAIDACKKAMQPFLEKLEVEKRERAEAARREADRQREEAEAAIRATREADLSQREEAERLLREAKRAETAATRAENDKAQAKGSGRAASLRTRHVAEVTDMRAFARFCWEKHYDVLDEFLRGFAQQKADAGARDIPGVAIREERSVV